MEYVFWPQSLEKGKYGSKIVLALRESDTGWMVLALLEKQEYTTLLNSGNCEKYGFSRIGTWEPNSGLNFEINPKALVFLVKFKPPRLNLMQFYSLEPIALVLPEKDYLIDSTSNKHRPLRGQSKSTDSSNCGLRKSINLINLYRKHLHSLSLANESGIERETSQSSLFSRKALFQNSVIRLRHCAIYLIACAHFLAATLVAFLNMTPLKLVSFSSTAQQIDLRSRQLCYFPEQFLRIYNNESLGSSHTTKLRPHNTAHVQVFPCNSYPDYIRFYNTVWLIANDVSFGLSVGTLLAENQRTIAVFLNNIFTRYLFEKVHFVTEALSQNPLGIKLNGELAKFLSDLFLWTIDFSYSLYIKRITSAKNIGMFINVISTASCCFGVTFALAIAVDLISFVTMHISLFYFISAKMYHWQLHIMQTLLYLFYGKKRNVLRNRVDSNLFELDQLLMGTLFFTILIFLLPTFLIFYVLFTILRLTVLLPELVLEFIMALLNHFPLFVLLLRIKDPMRIPGGILLQPVNGGPEFKLENNPLSLRRIFRPYAVLLSTMAETYFSVSTFREILVGYPMTIKRHRMYRILYSTLPEVPTKTSQVWVSLMSFANKRGNASKSTKT
ncbi:LAFA_0E02872g1_1 [Lachancea sp. 'fantastica']|nr:LAFA_0E02872g1_1 [Lachancea sp. 'fantastica']